MSDSEMRALVVSNMQADEHARGRGSFVRDQVNALARLDGIDVELFEFAPGVRSLARASFSLRRRFRGQRFDVVHAHYGLTQWPALAVSARVRAVTLHGTDLRHPRTRRLTQAALGRMDLVACASSALATHVSTRPGRDVAVLPCGVSLERFRPISRIEARTQLGLDPEGPYLLFPADPARAGKRHDLAVRVAGDIRLLTAGSLAPAEMPLWINAANAVVIPSEAEGFGLGALEALACDVPVLATPVGVHPLALDGVPGTLCAAFDADRWRHALEPHLRGADPRVPGRVRAQLFSSGRMAARVAEAWRASLAAR